MQNDENQYVEQHYIKDVTMWNDLCFSLKITVPICIILGLGIYLKRINLINNEFARVGSALVFNVALPCLLFVKLSKVDFTHELPLLLVGYAALATVVVFVGLELICGLIIKENFSRGVFVQGAFRSNMTITGLAFCISAFGEPIIGVSSIYISVMTIMFNVLSIITLVRHSVSNNRVCFTILFLEVIKNPIIISIVLSVIISTMNVQIPVIIMRAGEYFADMTLPLALVCSGASIRMNDISSFSQLYLASIMKLVFVPLIITSGGIVIGLRNEQLGILYLMCSSSTAVVSYPMAQAMKGNHYMAAAIVAITSIGAMISTTIGIFLLRLFNLI